MPRRTEELGGEAGPKNLRNRARAESPATNNLIAAQSAASTGLIRMSPPARVP
jgi:hypothetical protein